MTLIIWFNYTTKEMSLPQMMYNIKDMSETGTGAIKYSRGRFVLVLVLYLMGLFIGALDTGIVTPARTVIQNDLGVDASTGIWMITIYTLFYAASIPVMGKLADMFGRKYVYIVSISLFGLGSLFCGLSSSLSRSSTEWPSRT